MCLAECVHKNTTEAHDPEATIVVEFDNGIACVRLNRPDSLNALTPEMGPQYAQILATLDGDPRVRGILVTGAGRGFCSGADLGALMESHGTLHEYVAGQSMQTLPALALSLGTPVATAINGPCAGIGFVLAISADARFVSPGATMSTTFARLGLVAEYGVAWLLPRLIGLPAATDLLFSGRTITGVRAQELGLAICAEDPVDAARAWLTEITENAAPSSVAAMKRQLLLAERQTLSDAIDSSLVEMAAAFDSPDFAEALAARMEKRPPQFADYPATD